MVLLKITIIILIYLCNLHVSFADETIRLANGEWAPYFSTKLKYYGIGSRIVAEAFHLEGIKVEYGFFPWKRAFEIAKEGKWPGVVGFESSTERTPYFYADEFQTGGYKK